VLLWSTSSSATRSSLAWAIKDGGSSCRAMNSSLWPAASLSTSIELVESGELTVDSCVLMSLVGTSALAFPCTDVTLVSGSDRPFEIGRLSPSGTDGAAVVSAAAASDVCISADVSNGCRSGSLCTVIELSASLTCVATGPLVASDESSVLSSPRPLLFSHRMFLGGCAW